MKIKTITCHEVYNAGASLQAYALVKYLSDSGHDVKIIHYKPEYLSHHYQLDYVANPKYESNLLLKLIYLTLKLPGRLLKLRDKAVFDRFTKKYLPLTQVCYRTNDELKKNVPEAELFLAGSDQIWNPTFPNGKDPAFFLDFVPEEKKKASYAASFAVDQILEQEQRTWIGSRLESFDLISVRELSGLDILKECGIKTGVQVLDPVFLLEPDHWREMCLSLPEQKPYLFVYDFENDAVMSSIAKAIARNNGLEIVSAFPVAYADRILKHWGPLEFLSYLRNADFVLSNSFHATAFSILFQKQFAVVNRKEGINARMRDLLRLFHLEDRLLLKEDGAKDVQSFEYGVEFHQRLKTQIQSSKTFLDRCVGDETID